MLWRYRPADLEGELGFPHRYHRTLAALARAGREAPDDLVLRRALVRLARLAPEVAGPAPPPLEPDDVEPSRRDDPLPEPVQRGFSVTSVLLDL